MPELTATVGLNVVRMNFSHGSYEYHQSVIDNAREAAKKLPGRPLAIALDTVFNILFCNLAALLIRCRKDLKFGQATQSEMQIFQFR